MARENERQAVKDLQKFLRHLSYFNETIDPAPIDGIFDTATEAALRAFQQAVGLPVTGRADRLTLERLYAAYRASVAERQAPARMAYFPQIPENYRVEVGDAQFLVSIIQNALLELAVVYEGLDAVPQSGVYDEQTAAAVRRLQAVFGLPENGAVDRTTWNAIADAYNRTFHAPYSRE